MQSYQKSEILARIKQKEPNFAPIYECLRGLKTIHLTKCGQCKLMAFPEHIVILGLAELEKNAFKLRDDRFNYLFSVIKCICDREGIRPDWSWPHQLLEALQIPKDYAPEVIKPFPKSPGTIKSGKKQENKEATPEYYKQYKHVEPEKKDICIEARKVKAQQLEPVGKEFFALIGLPFGFPIIKQLEEFCAEFGIDPQIVYQSSITEEDIRNTKVKTPDKQ